MIQVLVQMLVEEEPQNGNRVGIKFFAHHSGVHASKRELALVHTLIEAMKTTSALATIPPVYAAERKPKKRLALLNGKKPHRKKKAKCLPN